MTTATPRDEECIGYRSPDGLTLSARKISGPTGHNPVVLCLHGLTRNSRDFDGVAVALSPSFTLLIPDQRGRGRSTYDPNPANYNPVVQASDMWALLDHCGVDRCVIMGTSMGALMAIIMANQQRERIAGLILNDAGPEVDPKGLARIRSYMGGSEPPKDWSEAAAAVKRIHSAALPTYGPEDWIRFARATYVEDDGVIRLDYDPALAGVFAADSGTAPNMWPMFEIMNAVPSLLVRGELSDILSQDTAAKMARTFPTATVVTVPDRGHAPDLTEPAAFAAIEAFLTDPAVIARLVYPDRQVR